MNTYAGRMNFIPRDGFHPAQSRLKMETMTTPSLSERLDYLRGASPTWRERYDELVARLRALEVGTRAPRVGDRFPEIVLPDHRGRYRTLTSLLADGPLVVSFKDGIKLTLDTIRPATVLAAGAKPDSERIVCAGYVLYRDGNGTRRRTGFCRQFDLATGRWSKMQDDEYEYYY